MTVKTTFDIKDIGSYLWLGGLENFNRLVDIDKLDWLNNILSSLEDELECCNEVMSLTELNDFMWFDIPEMFFEHYKFDMYDK